MPRFVLPSGRRPAGDVFLPWLLVLVVLLPWCCTAAGFARGGGATLRGVPRFKNSHGRRPSIHGEGEPPKVGEPRRGAPAARPQRWLDFAPTYAQGEGLNKG